jgi:caa(3)-type oxidase subunit IV
METTHKAHPTPKTYLTVFGWLAILTLIEIAVSAVPLPVTPQIAILVVIAVIKAALVIMFYMHLRYDSAWYTLILLTGLFFALLIGRFLLLITFK